MYQIAILDAIGGKSAVLRSTLESRLRDLQLDASREAEFLNEHQLDRLRVDCPRVGVLFSGGAAGQALASQVQTLLDSPAVVVPAVTSLTDFPAKVPAALQATNGLELDPADPGLERVAALILELLGLLRKRRRLFISYRRSESAAVAQQLYHALDERSFDVFLDTLSVRAGAQFQEQLWHRMADSDVVILLYTQSVHKSGWVEQEIERASGMKVTVLQLIWPGVSRDPKTALFEPLYLQASDFDAAQPDRIAASRARAICTLVESLRASSLARREAELVGTLRDRAERQKLTVAVQPMRHVDIHCSTQRFARVIPSVGVPDSEAIQDCALAPVQGASPGELVLLYDSLHVTTNWRAHLDWISGYLPVKTLKVFEVDQWLKNLCP
jgi:TIR domain